MIDAEAQWPGGRFVGTDQPCEDSARNWSTSLRRSRLYFVQAWFNHSHHLRQHGAIRIARLACRCVAKFPSPRSPTAPVVHRPSTPAQHNMLGCQGKPMSLEDECKLSIWQKWQRCVHLRRGSCSDSSFIFDAIASGSFVRPHSRAAKSPCPYFPSCAGTTYSRGSLFCTSSLFCAPRSW